MKSQVVNSFCRNICHFRGGSGERSGLDEFLEGQMHRFNLTLGQRVEEFLRPRAKGMFVDYLAHEGIQR